MSARPRPVTATIKPPQYESTPIRSDRSYSPYSTGDSTHSLISILDHDSCDELENDDNKRDNKYDYNKQIDNEDKNIATEDTDKNVVNKGKKHKPSARFDDQRKKGNDSKADDLSAKMEDLKVKNSDLFEESKSDLEKSSITDSEKPLSPWDQWLIEKAKLDRQRLKDLQTIKEKDRELKLQEEREKIDQLKKAEENRIKWEHEKNRKQKLQKQTEQQKQKMEKELKEEEQRHIKVKAEQKYKEWVENKKEADAKLKQDLEEKKRIEDEKILERRATSEKAFIAWKMQASLRPKTAPNLSKKPLGYYERNSCYSPSYVNPIPWQPIAAPPPKTVKKTKNTRKTKLAPRPWNPSKYF